MAYTLATALVSVALLLLCVERHAYVAVVLLRCGSSLTDMDAESGSGSRTTGFFQHIYNVARLHEGKSARVENNSELLLVQQRPQRGAQSLHRL